jgi:hypothetical protein
VERKSVKSSNIRSVGHDPETSTLEVEFTSGTVYRYDGVPASVAAELLKAESVGSYFAKRVRKAYKGTKVEAAPAPAAPEVCTEPGGQCGTCPERPMLGQTCADVEH